MRKSFSFHLGNRRLFPDEIDIISDFGKRLQQKANASGLTASTDKLFTRMDEPHNKPIDTDSSL